MGMCNYHRLGPNGVAEITMHVLEGQILLTQEAINTLGLGHTKLDNYKVNALKQSDRDCKTPPTLRMTNLDPISMGMHNQGATHVSASQRCKWITNFNNVKVMKKIGKGTLGTIYTTKVKAYGNSELAIKHFNKQSALGENTLLKIFQESTNLTNLQHTNILIFSVAHMH
ncbi:uncharacterized protein ACA1_160150 [Acanthamoeba castellanii str. Neff]|uniref:Protein kinase domain-containing protein n=1 Tax=Acanthamoeba castellanii (strain ATCC 30010 / Neff) TaxID=1257118 RepID=L8HA92_ACACF|nr:uncharacterized protein ACA1_160150 [Acanthamoeba castellanii str. Neff]ELR22147.1 hypothetical protein ACA1_160150 [Acanthamoeba castellanii str. Neff]